MYSELVRLSLAGSHFVTRVAQQEFLLCHQRHKICQQCDPSDLMNKLLRTFSLTILPTALVTVVKT